MRISLEQLRGSTTLKTPPFLLGAALVFWGLQTDFLAVGALLAVVLEGSRWVRLRWEFSDDDFSRILSVCSVLLIGCLIYGFTSNEGPTRFSRVLMDPSFGNQTSAGAAGAQMAIALFRWLPMIFFLLVTAQAYSMRETVPWTAISVILRRRWEQARAAGRVLPGPQPGVNFSYPYFGTCLFAAASSHTAESQVYFWGFCVLLVWSLWSQRSRRFGLIRWAMTLVLAVGLGVATQHSVARIQNSFTRFNVSLLVRFLIRGGDPARSNTALGQIGRIQSSGAIVIRLKPKSGAPPTYLREASYRVFSSPATWWPGGSLDTRELLLETNGVQAVVLRGKTNGSSVQIACYLDNSVRLRSDSATERASERWGLLPLPAGSGLLDNMPVFALTIYTNALGVVKAEGPGLVIFDACYGPGAMLDSAPGTNDLMLPQDQREVPALDKIVSELNLQETNTVAVLARVSSFFESKFRYSVWQDPPKSDSIEESPLSRFLLKTRSGHCEYFASATVLLLRRLNIPARYAVGYAVHEVSHGGYVVRSRDAHAWCLAWDSDAGKWIDFDTTPGTWVAEEAKRASALQWLSDAWSRMTFEFAKFRWSQTHYRPYLLMLLAPVLGFLIYKIFFGRDRQRTVRRRPTAGNRMSGPGRDSEFYLVERRLAERGVERSPNEPLSTWLHRLKVDPAVADLEPALHKLLRLHYRYRFDPQTLPPSDRAELRKGAEQILERVTAAGTRT